MTVGVLALQGGYDAHRRALVEVGHEVRLVRKADDLDRLDGLVLPGGESSTQLLLVERNALADPLDAFVRSGRPVLCTCAGLILAASRVSLRGHPRMSDPAQSSFGWIDVDVARNAWGRQVHSFQAESESGRPMLFIRAPRFTRVGEGVEVLDRYQGEPVLVRQGAVVGASWHPELTADRSLHRDIFDG